MEPAELAENIAVWLLDVDFLADKEIMERYEIDDFELIKAKEHPMPLPRHSG